MISNNQFTVDYLSADIVLKLSSTHAFNMRAVSEVDSSVEMFDLSYDGRYLRLNTKVVDMDYQQVAQSDSVDLRLILDASSVEMFVNSQFSVTVRSYPELTDDLSQLLVIMTGEGLLEANVWQMKKISDDRLTTNEELPSTSIII